MQRLTKTKLVLYHLYPVFLITVFFVILATGLVKYYFFLSSRRRHTSCYRDWSSDVCSSDLSRRWAHPRPGSRARSCRTPACRSGSKAASCTRPAPITSVASCPRCSTPEQASSAVVAAPRPTTSPRCGPRSTPSPRARRRARGHGIIDGGGGRQAIGVRRPNADRPSADPPCADSPGRQHRRPLGW